MKILLETERLILRQFTEDDEDYLFQISSDSEVFRFFPNLKLDRKYIQTFLKTNFTLYKEYDGYGYWAVIEKKNNKIIGWFTFRPLKYAPTFDPDVHNPDYIELGYIFQKSVWGQGYATEGAEALIVKGFNELSAQCIVAGTVTTNIASVRVLEKVGLKFQTSFFDKEYNGEVSIYGLEKNDYSEGHAHFPLSALPEDRTQDR